MLLSYPLRHSTCIKIFGEHSYHSCTTVKKFGVPGWEQKPHIADSALAWLCVNMHTFVSNYSGNNWPVTVTQQSAHARMGTLNAGVQHWGLLM